VSDSQALPPGTRENSICCRECDLPNPTLTLHRLSSGGP
jgi:hypothetical protein